MSLVYVTRVHGVTCNTAGCAATLTFNVPVPDYSDAIPEQLTAHHWNAWRTRKKGRVRTYCPDHRPLDEDRLNWMVL